MPGQWPQLGVCTPFLPCKAKITFTLKYYFCVNCCGCICKKKVVKGKGYIILVYSAQLLVFHDSTWTNLLNACRLISLWAECHKWVSKKAAYSRWDMSHSCRKTSKTLFPLTGDQKGFKSRLKSYLQKCLYVCGFVCGSACVFWVCLCVFVLTSHMPGIELPGGRWLDTATNAG